MELSSHEETSTPRQRRWPCWACTPINHRQLRLRLRLQHRLQHRPRLPRQRRPRLQARLRRRLRLCPATIECSCHSSAETSLGPSAFSEHLFGIGVSPTPPLGMWEYELVGARSAPTSSYSSIRSRGGAGAIPTRSSGKALAFIGKDVTHPAKKRRFRLEKFGPSPGQVKALEAPRA